VHREVCGQDPEVQGRLESAPEVQCLMVLLPGTARSFKFPHFQHGLKTSIPVKEIPSLQINKINKNGVQSSLLHSIQKKKQRKDGRRRGRANPLTMSAHCKELNITLAETHPRGLPSILPTNVPQVSQGGDTWLEAQAKAFTGLPWCMEGVLKRELKGLL